ncbi:amino acid permease [soil metagenome]
MPTFRKVGLTTCISLVLANMVGIGVFTSLGFQVGPLHSPFLILLVWILGGIVALCGAMSYAELAAALPRSGGEYNFLSQIYHPAVGFMSGFVSATVGFAAPIALAAMAFGHYLSAAFPAVPPLAASLAIVLLLAATHSFTVRASGNFQIVITLFKVALIVSFIALGLWKGDWSRATFVPHADDTSRLLSSSFAIALMYVLYAYSGWNAAAYIIGEVREPQRTVPRALLLGTLLVMVLYVALNAVFLIAAPMAEYTNQVDVGKIAASHLLGENGGRIMSTLISAGLISVLSAMTWAGPRVAQIIGQDFATLRFLSRTSPGGIPRLALGLQTAIVLVLLLTATFDQVLVYVQVALEICAGLTVLGVIVLRFRQPDLPRPFRCWGYPFTPLVFLALSLFAVIYTTMAKPIQAIAGISTLLFGVAVYFLVAKRR